MIISIDPSSTSMGVALFHDDGSNHLADPITPDNDRAEYVERVHQMARYLLEIIDEAEAISPIRIAIIEKPPRNQGPRSNPGAQHAAFGVVYHVCRCAKIQTIIPVEPGWTRNKDKTARQFGVRQELGLYGNEDKGGDAVDAFQLGRWWIDRNPDRLLVAERCSS